MPEYEYFVRIYPPERTVERPGGLWRRSGETWEYWSILDWQWHGLREDEVAEPPPEGGLVQVSPERAAGLVADRQGWVRYWAFYIDEPDHGVEPTTVLRRRSSPEQLRDEVFNIHDEWGPTDTILEFEFRRLTFPYHLVEIDQATAEAIIRRSTGIEDATAL
jgi:hypothetical protein